MRIVGLLLAAGAGTRFGGDKLLAPLAAGVDGIPAGTPVGTAACRRIVAALPETVAVIRPRDAELALALAAEDARVVECARAGEGMGESLACGVRATADADGWVVALADMPWIASATIAAVADALRGGAVVAAPFVDGSRGHPVGFGRAARDALLALTGDAGAREVVRRYADAIVRIDVDDPAVLRDVDTPADLAPPPAR